MTMLQGVYGPHKLGLVLSFLFFFGRGSRKGVDLGIPDVNVIRVHYGSFKHKHEAERQLKVG